MSAIPPIASSAASEIGKAAESLASTSPALDPSAAFSQALLELPSVASSPPAHAAGGLAGHLASGMRELSAKLASWHTPEAVSTSPTAGKDDLGASSMTVAMRDAVAGLEGSYTFAIEATLASRGSTETTKIMNTLLKGQ